MNLSTLLTLIDDSDPTVEDQLSRYYQTNISPEKVSEFESIRDKINPDRIGFYDVLNRSMKLTWFETCLDKIIENPSVENIPQIENILLALNVFFPELLSVSKSKNELRQLTEEIRDRIIPIADPHFKLLEISQVLFYNHQFGGNSKSYYDILNSDFSHVLESKHGIPISLSMLTFIICKNLNIHCIPANIPRHFMLFFPSDQPVYMDCFNSGNLLSPDDLTDFLTYLHIDKPITSYHEENFLVILKRWFQNMSFIYSNQNDEESMMKIQPYIHKINQHLSPFYEF